MTYQPNTPPSGVATGTVPPTSYVGSALPGVASCAPGIFEVGYQATPWGAQPIRTDAQDRLTEARREYGVVFTAYNKAVTLQQTQKAHEIWPALRTAKTRLMKAQMEAGL